MASILEEDLTQGLIPGLKPDEYARSPGLKSGWQIISQTILFKRYTYSFTFGHKFVLLLPSLVPVARNQLEDQVAKQPN